MKKITILVLLLFIFGNLPTISADISPSRSMALDETTSIGFSYANSSLAISMLSNNITSYDVTFYGTGWSLVEIEGWQNTGEVTFIDEAYLNFTNADIDGEIWPKDNTKVSFFNSALGKITVYYGAFVYFDGCDVAELSRYNSYHDGNDAIIKNTVINYLYSPMIIDGDDVTIDGLTYHGDIKGMNITIDDASVIDEGYAYLQKFSDIAAGYIQINGRADVSYKYSFALDPNLDHQIEIIGTPITMYSYFENIHNLMLTNVKLDYESDSTGLYLLNVNGTIDGMLVNRGELMMKNSDMNVLNSDLANVTYQIDADYWASDFQPEFNSTIIRGDFHLDATVPFKNFDLDVLGKVYMKAVAFGPESSWEEIDGGINYSSMYKSSLLNEDAYEIYYQFKVLEGVTFTLTSSSIYSIDSANATINMYSCTIYSPWFGFNTTVNIWDGVLQPYVYNSGYASAIRFGDNSSVSIYGSHIIGNAHLSTYSWQAKFLDIHLENVNFSANLHLAMANLTMVNSYINEIVQWDGNPCTVMHSITNSRLDGYVLRLGHNIRYEFNLEDTEIGYFRGGDPGSSAADLHMVLDNVTIFDDYNWDWSQVYDLTVINSIFGRVDNDLVLRYYESHIRIYWSFGSAYGYSLTDTYEIQRSRYEDGYWNNWEHVDTASGNSYGDYGIAEGEIYAYRVLAHYDGGFMIYAISLNREWGSHDQLIAARMGYNVTGGLNNYGDIYLDPNSNSIQVHFEFQVFLPNMEYQVSSESVVVQYEYHKVEQGGVEAHNLTMHYVDITFYESGDYVLKARAASEQIRFWGEYLEVYFTILEYNNGEDTTSEGGNNEPSLDIPGFSFAFSSLGLFVTSYALRRKLR